MASLTASQVNYLRDMIGDDGQDNSGAYELSDVVLQEIYDDTAQGNGQLDHTIVWALRRRYGRAINLVTKTSGENSAVLNQKTESIRRLLDYWEGVIGIAGGQTRGSSVTFVYRADSLQTEAPTFSDED